MGTCSALTIRDLFSQGFSCRDNTGTSPSLSRIFATKGGDGFDQTFVFARRVHVIGDSLLVSGSIGRTNATDGPQTGRNFGACVLV